MKAQRNVPYAGLSTQEKGELMRAAQKRYGERLALLQTPEPREAEQDLCNALTEVARNLRHVQAIAYAGWTSREMDERDHEAILQVIGDIAEGAESKIKQLLDRVSVVQ